MQGIKLPLHKLITPTINILQVLHQSSFKVLFIQLIKKAQENGKIKWVLTKYETLFDFCLSLFMSGYKCPPSEINWCKTCLALKDDFLRYRLSHLCPLINKVKKKSNQGSYLVCTHLIFPVQSTYLRNGLPKPREINTISRETETFHKK